MSLVNTKDDVEAPYDGDETMTPAEKLNYKMTVDAAQRDVNSNEV